MKAQVTVFGRPTTSITDVDDWVAAARPVRIDQRARGARGTVHDRTESGAAALARDRRHARVGPSGSRSPGRRSWPDDRGTLPSHCRAGSGGSASASRRPRPGAATRESCSPNIPTRRCHGDELPRFARISPASPRTAGIASLLTTVDASFANSAAGRVLEFQPATGVLKRMSSLRRWFF